MQKTRIYVAFPGTGKSSYVKMNENCLDMDSAYIGNKNDGWEIRYVTDIRREVTSGKYDAVFVSLNHNVIRELVKTDMDFSIIAPRSPDPIVKEMIIGRLLLRTGGIEHIRWLKRIIRRYDSVTNNETLSGLAPGRKLYLIDCTMPYISSFPEI